MGRKNRRQKSAAHFGVKSVQPLRSHSCVAVSCRTEKANYIINNCLEDYSIYTVCATLPPYHAAENYFAKIVRKHDLYIIENEHETQFIPSLLHIDNRLIDKDTGEILSEEEMREFDGDIYEPQGIDEPETVTKQSIPNEIFALFGNKVEVR